MGFLAEIFMKQLTRQVVIQELQQYFKVQELVCPHTFSRLGDDSWMIFDTSFLHTLLVIRKDILQVPLIANDYVFGGRNTQRGNRCNMCEIVKEKTTAYLSAHVLAKAIDVVSSRMTAEEMRVKIKEKKELLPYNIRIEKSVTWLHFDLYDMNVKIFEFKP